MNNGQLSRYALIGMLLALSCTSSLLKRCCLTDNLSNYLERKQAQAGNRLGAIASIMLLPTFVVGLYGMNIDPEYFPEFGWLNGYLMAWLMILLITVVQYTFFRRKGWL